MVAIERIDDFSGNTLWTAIFPTRPAFLCGAVRVLGSEGGGGIRVRILELSSMSSQFSGSIISFPTLASTLDLTIFFTSNWGHQFVLLLNLFSLRNAAFSIYVIDEVHFSRTCSYSSIK